MWYAFSCKNGPMYLRLERPLHDSMYRVLGKFDGTCTQNHIHTSLSVLAFFCFVVRVFAVSCLGISQFALSREIVFSPSRSFTIPYLTTPYLPFHSVPCSSPCSEIHVHTPRNQFFWRISFKVRPVVSYVSSQGSWFLLPQPPPCPPAPLLCLPPFAV